MKKLFIPLSILLLTITFSVNAVTNEQMGAVLERFTARQYDLLFKSDLVNFSSEYSNVFRLEEQAGMYESLRSEAEAQRESVQNERDAIVKTIGSLEESIAMLDTDIEEATKKVNKTNSDIIKTKAEIDVNTKEIDELKQKVEENTEILLQYLIYIYKKTNTAYSGEEIDNIKSILLNGESIGDLINDLYFKGIIQVTGKKLLDEHRKYISELYIKKINLERQEQDLKTLRKQAVIEQKILQDKKNFKENLLQESKGQQIYYEKYLEAKLKQEQDLKLKAITEQLRLTTTRTNILEKYNCEYLDLSKNTVEARIMQMKNPRCYAINRIIVSENELQNKSETGARVPNPLLWPVNPVQGISAFYRDQEYKETFGAEHYAIDIKVPQGTDVSAPMDGYVIYMNKPNSPDYSYLAIKHYDGYVTVYGHLSEILVDEYQFVEKGQLIAKSGGEFGTYGAGYATTGPHLHLETFRNGEYIDPLSVLDLSYIKYQQLPERYALKYEFDFKNANGYDYSELNANSKVFVLEGKTEIERQKYLLSKYAAADFNNWQIWINEALDGGIDPSFVMCIGLAESGLGRSLSSAYNIGNVGNNDRGDRRDYANAKEGIQAMVYALNNKYLINYDDLARLSGGGREAVGYPACGATPTEYCYATDTQHWHNNMKRCLSHLKGFYVDDYYKFRY